MAVESRFVVIRNGAEVQTFMDKKSADEYDKMLDMADNLTAMFESAPVELGESLTEELSVFLAQNREEVLVALQAKKPKPVKKIIAAIEKNIALDVELPTEEASPKEAVSKETPPKEALKKKAPSKAKTAKKTTKDAA